MKSEEYDKYVVRQPVLETAIEDIEDIGMPGRVIQASLGELHAVWPEGRKDDGGKPRHDLIPPELNDAVARVLTFGADKYGERNWEKGMRWGRPFAALMRHLWAWWRGEARDRETGMSHLWHAACCLTFLIAYEERREGTDDRPDNRRAEDANV